MKANSKEEAWKMADEIFPTDYIKDEQSSANAGYPVYRSTASGEKSYLNYICDLGDRLEVNLETGKTVNIWIEQKPEIKEIRLWSCSDVRECCIAHNLYTCGTIAEYSKMLDYVESEEPTVENLYWVAKDIQEHSEEQTITNVMCLLNKDAVRTVYELNE